MTQKTKSFKECEQAFSRIKNGEFSFEKNIGKRVTPAMVSQEAGLDKGYLKRSRLNHKVLIMLIDEYAKTQDSMKLSELKKKQKLEQKKNEADNYRNLYEESLARELKLLNQLYIYEQELKKLRSL